MIAEACQHPWAVWAIAYLLTFLGSGVVVRRALAYTGQHPPAGEARAGVIIGKVENFLIVTFVAMGEFTALALVFAAKSLVRHDEKGQGSYIVLGTLTNLAWSLAVAGSARALLSTC